MRSGGKKIIFLGWVFGGLLLGGGYLAYERLRITAPASPDPTHLTLGRKLYGENCAACHGAELEGQANWRERDSNGLLPAPPHDETGHTWHHPDDHLFLMTKHGIKPPLAPLGYESDMPAFSDVLTEAEIWAALSFIKNTWQPRPRTFQERLDKAYRNQATEK